jgi:3-dehydroquinate synthase
MRGVPVVQVPTTLVAMIDSSVGGKTGVDTSIGKNLVGAFHPPRLVAVDPEVSGTLPQDVRAQGLAEAVKHGAILDRAYLAELEKEMPLLLAGDAGATARAVLRSIEIKSEVVSEDERESGLRQILNFGHTLGHALESASDFGIPHGSAVALGMILEARLGEAMGVTEAGSSKILERVVSAMGLPTEIPKGVSVDEVVHFTQMDKKGRKGKPRYVLLSRLGLVDPDGGWGQEVPVEEVERVLGGT